MFPSSPIPQLPPGCTVPLNCYFLCLEHCSTPIYSVLQSLAQASFAQGGFSQPLMLGQPFLRAHRPHAFLLQQLALLYLSDYVVAVKSLSSSSVISSGRQRPCVSFIGVAQLLSLPKDTEKRCDEGLLNDWPLSFNYFVHSSDLTS